MEKKSIFCYTYLEIIDFENMLVDQVIHGLSYFLGKPGILRYPFNDNWQSKDEIRSFLNGDHSFTDTTIRRGLMDLVPSEWEYHFYMDEYRIVIDDIFKDIIYDIYPRLTACQGPLKIFYAVNLNEFEDITEILRYHSQEEFKIAYDINTLRGVFWPMLGFLKIFKSEDYDEPTYTRIIMRDAREYPDILERIAHITIDNIRYSVYET